MPGLLRGIARTAVVAGTATAVSNRVSRRQANRWAEQGEAEYGAQPEPEQDAAAPAPDPLAQLKELGQLKKDGILTDEEFREQKQKILNA